MIIAHKVLVALAIAGAIALPAVAQQSASPTPFDMTPESNLRTAPVEPPPVVEPAPQMEAPPPAPASFERHIVPFAQLQLVGEDARRAVEIYLTQAQAEAPASIEVGYLNAIVAAPEASTLAVSVNGTSIASGPIDASATTGKLQATIPTGLLRAGGNIIEFKAVQRHRTDCSVASTYELWTQIDPATTLLRFEGTGLDRITDLSEVAAIGFDATAMTTVRFIVPELKTPAVTAAALELVQQVALALHVPEIVVELGDTLPAETPVGTLNVVLATAATLPPDVGMMQAQASSGPLAAFAPASAAGNTLVVSGPDWSSITTAMRAISAASTPADPDLLPQRVDLANPIPRVTGATSLTLSDLGVPTIEFNGRRYRTSFEFALPSDFYANMYGQAQLLLDAGYSQTVLPGSVLDIYANGQIASATPVLRTDGGLSRATPIKVPMTNFRPGRNEIEIELLLQTEADLECAPGLTGTAPPRFLFSNTTQFNIPDFARAAALPDLQAFAGTGAPYGGGQSVPLLLGEGEQVTPAAMTWLARLAIASGTVVPVTLVGEGQLDPSANALVISPLVGLSDDLLNRSGVARTISAGPGATSDRAIVDRFNQTVGAPSGNAIDTIRNWVADKVGLAPQNFWLTRPEDGAYLPQSSDAVVVAQAVQPQGGVWTFLTIPDANTLLGGVQRLTQTVNWRAITGRVSALGPNDPTVIAVQPGGRTLVQTQPFSLFNLRLVAANWLSTNVLEFTALLAGVALVLTLVTAALLRTLGRRQ
jgi:hypothetical protein